MSGNNNQKSAGYAILGVIIVFAIIGFFVSLTEKEDPKCAFAGCDNTVSTEGSYCYQHNTPGKRRKAAYGTSSSHSHSTTSSTTGRGSSSIVREAVRIPVHRLAVTSQAVRTASITAVIRMILTIAATMMSTWMAIMIRTGTTGMMIMQPVWMMPSRKISRMETKGTGKGNIREFLISGTETQKMV